MRGLAKYSAAVGLTAAAICWTASIVAADDVDTFSQGFEVNTDGWDDSYGGAVTRAPSGTDGVQSFEGAYHATIPIGADSGPVTRWGGFRATFPALGYETRIAVFVATDLADGADKRLAFSSAIDRPDGQHRRDFIFHLGTKPGAEGVWCASVSNNAPGEPCSAIRQPVEITQSGWYQLVSHFRANPTNVLEVEMQVLDHAGTLVGSWILSEPTDIIGETVGGNRYGWFAYNAFDALPIDASQRTSMGAAPTSQHVIVGGAGAATQDQDSYGFRLFAHHKRNGSTKHFQLRFVRIRGQQEAGDPGDMQLDASRDYFEGKLITWLSAEQSGGLDLVFLAGTGRWNNTSGYTFEAVVRDGSERGRGTDTFAIVVRDPHGDVVARVTSAPLSLGDISTYIFW
jgi:hypothetical protein